MRKRIVLWRVPEPTGETFLVRNGVGKRAQSELKWWCAREIGRRELELGRYGCSVLRIGEKGLQTLESVLPDLRALGNAGG